MPENTIYVGKPSKWANPFDWDDYITELHDERQAKQFAIDDFKGWLAGKINMYRDSRDRMLEELDELRGFDLVCWCKPDEPCHADVLLELANEE